MDKEILKYHGCYWLRIVLATHFVLLGYRKHDEQAMFLKVPWKISVCNGRLFYLKLVKILFSC